MPVAAPDLNQFQLHLLPGKGFLNGESFLLHESAYKTWRELWNIEMSKVGGDRRYAKSDGFLRQDVILVVTYKSEIIGLMGQTIYDLRTTAVKDCDYLSLFPQPTVLELVTRGINTFCTMEYLIVHPAWRRSPFGFSFADLIGVAGIRYGMARNVDAMLGTARVDIKVDQMLYAVGGEPLADAWKNNTPVKLVAILKGNQIEPADLTFRTLLNLIWNKRVQIEPSLLKDRIAA